MQEYITKLEEIKKEATFLLKSFNFNDLNKEINNIEEELKEPGIWGDHEKAGSLTKKLKQKKDELNDLKYLKEEPSNLIELCLDIDFQRDSESEVELEKMIDELEKKVNEYKIKTCFKGRHDKNNTILEIHTGTGGRDAADFSNMLMRMYLRFAEKQGFNTLIINENYLEDGGLKSATILISGEYSFGYLKKENGVHRLIRLSPFNSGKSRETSFSAITVFPEIKESDMPKINNDDLKIDVFRASGKGGQSVNTTDSAVRITHLPTGLVVSCQNERSQLQNKNLALKILIAKLETLREEQNKKNIEELKGIKKEIAWGSQIRTYTLHPYKLVKDHRSGHEETNPEKVFDGEIEKFIKSNLIN